MSKTYFFRDHPILALTIGHGSAQVMQITHKNKRQVITAYGSTAFDPSAIKDSVIVNPEVVARAIRALLDNTIQGDVAARRLAISVPTTRTFSRAVTLPKLPDEQLAEAVMLEIEQYTPVAIDNLYVDYTIINATPKELEVLTLAAPKEVIDSYLQVAQILDLEPILIETRVDSIRRLFSMTQFGNIPSVLLDFDRDMVDISIVDKNIIATGTVPISTEFSNQITQALASKGKLLDLDAPMDDQKDDQSPQKNNQLQQFIQEIRRMVRYYEERYDRTRHIEQIVLVGDEARIPSLAALMTDKLRLPVRSADLWQLLEFDDEIANIPKAASGSYVTVAGLAAAIPSEVFA